MSRTEKIVIIGAGHVGSCSAMALARDRVGDEIVLVDIIAEKAAAQAADVADALAFLDGRPLVRSGSLADCADAAIVVIAIGMPRQPNTTRLDLLEDSLLRLSSLTADLNKIGLGGLVIVITNPVDIVADYVRRKLDLPRGQAFGTGTLLDTARLLRILATDTSISPASITAFALGEHGDSAMVAFSQARIGGQDLAAYPQLDQNSILLRTRAAGMDIINGKGSTEFGIGQALAILCRCILRDEKRIFPLSVELQGEYGHSGLHCSVPCLVGKKGIEEVIEISLTAKEQEQFNYSCGVISHHLQLGKRIAP
jgi:L-lactate dehydrogenase